MFNIFELKDIIVISSDFLIGVTAIVSLFISIRAIKKSDWNLAMNTAPAIILRPGHIYVHSRQNEGGGGSILNAEDLISNSQGSFGISFHMRFECFNEGRGVAFNISQPKIGGAIIINRQYHHIPLYQTLDDDYFVIEIEILKKFNEWMDIVDEKIPVKLILYYTNDQNNVFCKSFWSANIKPFDLINDSLKVRKTRLLKRRSGIDYSSKSFKNEKGVCYSIRMFCKCVFYNSFIKKR